jgi:hypothetical protein
VRKVSIDLASVTYPVSLLGMGLVQAHFCGNQPSNVRNICLLGP